MGIHTSGPHLVARAAGPRGKHGSPALAPPLDRDDGSSSRSASAAPDTPLEIEHLGLRAKPGESPFYPLPLPIPLRPPLCQCRETGGLSVALKNSAERNIPARNRAAVGRAAVGRAPRNSRRAAPP